MQKSQYKESSRDYSVQQLKLAKIISDTAK